MFRGKPLMLSVCAALLSFSGSGSSFAQAIAKFSFEGSADCYRPAIKNFPIRGEGSGVLSTDRSARLEMNSNVEGRVNYDVKLGGKPTDVANGTASLRVLNRRTLRAIRDYPNNILIIDVETRGNTCKLKLQSKLKPGKREYTFQTALGLAYCSQPVIKTMTCTAK